MNDSLKTLVDLFIENAQVARKEFTWQGNLVKRFAALMYAAEGKPIDCEAIRACRKLIKQNTSVFSGFRGMLHICLAAQLSHSDNWEAKLSDALEVYDAMKALKFRSSDYLAIAAMQIAANVDRAKYQQTVERARAFYEGMKANHRFYTGQDDYVFAAMLGLSELEVEAGLNRMEALFTQLKPELRTGNGLQGLTQVLVLGDVNDDAVTRVLSLDQVLRARKLKFERQFSLSSLGILSLLPSDVEAIAQDVEDVYKTLRAQKGFGVWSSDKQEILLFSAGLVALARSKDAQGGVVASALSTSIAGIIAQQMAMAAILASSAAASSASSSSS